MNAAELHEARVDRAGRRPGSAAARSRSGCARTTRSASTVASSFTSVGLIAAVDRARHQRQARAASPGRRPRPSARRRRAPATHGWQTAIECAPRPDRLEERRMTCSMYSSRPNAPCGERHVARVVPVGDVDVVVREHACARCRAAASRSGPTSARPRAPRGCGGLRVLRGSAAASRTACAWTISSRTGTSSAADADRGDAEGGRRGSAGRARTARTAAAAFRTGASRRGPADLVERRHGGLAAVRGGHIRSVCVWKAW